ncbi:MAG: methylenetetrahydrofolate reductase [NAD(P)H] [Chlorobiales bacterium]|nr:methylenetetrahydrofolate reductase [NAD(P)H] [Chlorobiales bacterium]
MRIKELFNPSKTCFSFEFYPPKENQDWDKLFHSITELMPLKPAYVSVTYGAGGSTRDKTHDLLVRIKHETDIPVVSHLTCVGSSRDEIMSILQHYTDSGIDNILALRGDPPKGATEFVAPKDGFGYAAELVGFISKHFPQMGIGVAGFPEGHPQMQNRLKEIEYLKAKVDAGADYIVTQLFFDNRDFYDFCERCEIAGIHVPIIPGIMPITTKKGMIRMAELAAGARFPSPLLKAVMNTDDDQEVADIGIRWAADQVRDLVNHNVTGIHFYTLNSAAATLKIFERINVNDSV